MEHSPAWILSVAMETDMGFAGNLFVDNQPDQPEESITIFNTTAFVDGRLMSGRTIIKPGCQLRARYSKASPQTAPENTHEKLLSVITWMDSVKRLLVSIDGTDYLIHAIRQSSGILPLGITEDNLYEATVNVVVTLTKI